MGGVVAGGAGAHRGGEPGVPGLEFGGRTLVCAGEVVSGWPEGLNGRLVYGCVQWFGDIPQELASSKSVTEILYAAKPCSMPTPYVKRVRKWRMATQYPKPKTQNLNPMYIKGSEKGVPRGLSPRPQWI